MRSEGRQIDFVRDSVEAQIRACHIAAERARVNPFETPDAGERRAAHYLAEAARLEQEARGAC